MSLAALCGGVLNAHDRFAPFALAPLIFNLCLIVALLPPVYGAFNTAGHASAWAVSISGLLQLLFLLACCWRVKITLRPQALAATPRLRRLLRLMGPSILGASVVQVNLLIDMILASFLPAGAVSYLYYADRLVQLPLSLIGTAVATALLPKLTRAIVAWDKKRDKTEQDAQDLFNGAMAYGLFLGIPAAVGLALLAEPIMLTLFTRGAFDGDAARNTAVAMAALAVGLPAFVLQKVLTTVFYARQDTKTPLRIAVVVVVTNAVLSLILSQFWGFFGLALATSLASWLQMVILSLVLRRSQEASPVRLLSAHAVQAAKITLATLAMGAVVWGLRQALPIMPTDSDLWRLGALAAIIAGGTVAFGFMALILGLIPPELTRILRRTKGITS
jgi:putative peptidoglycan lipid II flippase